MFQYSVLSSVWAPAEQASSTTYYKYNSRTRMGLIFLLLMLKTIMLSWALTQCPSGGPCLPPVLCAPHYLSSLYDPSSSSCLLTPDTPGLCCPHYHPVCRSSFIREGRKGSQWRKIFGLLKIFSLFINIFIIYLN